MDLGSDEEARDLFLRMKLLAGTLPANNSLLVVTFWPIGGRGGEGVRRGISYTILYIYGSGQ